MKDNSKTWDSIPESFKNELTSRLATEEFITLSDLLIKHKAFEQEFFKQGIEDFNETPIILNLFATFLGRMAVQLINSKQDLNDIEHILRISLKIDPNQCPNRAVLAFLLADVGKKDEAVKEAKIALLGIEQRVNADHELHESSDDIIKALKAIVSSK